MGKGAAMTGPDLLVFAAFGAVVCALLLLAEFGIYLVWLVIGWLSWTPRRRNTRPVYHLHSREEKR